MSQRLIQPGLSAAGKYHPRTALPLEPIGEINGKLIWPVIGGDEADDEDDPRFQDGGGEADDEDEGDDSDEEDEDEEDEDEDDKKKSKSKKKSKDEDDDEEDKPKYTEREYRKLEKRMKAADRRADETEKRLRDLEKAARKSGSKKLKGRDRDEDRDDDHDDEAIRREKERADKAEALIRETRLENAFLKVNTYNWVDADDALAAAERLGLLDDVFDEDGKLDRAELRHALKALAKKKPHLLKPSKNDEDDDTEKPDRRSGSTMNGKRKGQKGQADRKELAKRFPVLNR